MDFLLSQSERTYKKMNEYLYENECVQMDASKRLSDEEISISPNGENLNDEEIMIDVCRKTLHANRKKKLQKEKYRYGKSITHQGRIF